MSRPDECDDPQFVERFQAGDPQAIQAVADAYLQQILRAARATGLSLQEAEDATQATFEVVMHNASSFEGRSHVRTWLFGILYRKIRELRRELGREHGIDDIDATVESRFDAGGKWVRPPRDVSARLEDQEARDGIGECLETLSTSQRMAFVLREVEEISTREICKILETSVTNVGVLLFRARNRLRECLEAKGFGR